MCFLSHYVHISTSAVNNFWFFQFAYRHISPPHSLLLLKGNSVLIATDVSVFTAEGSIRCSKKQLSTFLASALQTQGGGAFSGILAPMQQEKERKKILASTLNVSVSEFQTCICMHAFGYPSSSENATCQHSATLLDGLAVIVARGHGVQLRK